MARWTGQPRERVNPCTTKLKRLEKALQDKEDYAYLLEETIKRVDQIKGTSFRKKLLESLPEKLKPKDE